MMISRNLLPAMPLRRIFILMLCSLFVGPALSSCRHASVHAEVGTGGASHKVKHKKGPPPWAPAHGYRNKHRYRYYHDQEVYYDSRGGTYIWLSGGKWQIGVKLPSSIRLSRDSDSYVMVDIEGSNPEPYHGDIKARYPRGGDYSKERQPRERRRDRPNKGKGQSKGGKGKGNSKGRGR